MAKLSKDQTRRHLHALEVLKKDRLTDDEREQVFRDFYPGADHMTGLAGAFFTPFELAGDVCIDLNGADRVLDLCAGIGVLSMFKYWRSRWDSRERINLELVCVEQNASYVEIGKKLLPWARWICADAFSLTADDLGTFDAVVSNPPFGKVRRSGNGPRYRGADFELALIDHASQFAPYGVFIVPTGSAPFVYSGAQCFSRRTSGRAVAFARQTGIRLDVGCGVDCAIYQNDWTDVAPAVEIVWADFENAHPVNTALPGLFDMKAS